MSVIKEHIRAQGIRQWQAASRMGINNGRLSSIINRKVEPNSNDRRKLETYFHAPIELLLEKETTHGS